MLLDDIFEYRRQGLIELIEWYGDCYHKSDFCHSEMIGDIRKLEPNDFDSLNTFEQVVDGWLDY